MIFGLCGHTVIGFLDALGKSRIRYISTRHEQVAAHAADGYARASGKVGVLLTHLGPGLTNAATGVANAALDSIPMVVIAGDIPVYYYGRHPHQEVNLHQDADQFQIFRPFCKRVYRVDNVARSAAHRRARVPPGADRAGPGPVLVDVPMDIFSADLDVDAFATTPPEIAKIGPRSGDGGAHRRCAGDVATPGALCRWRRAVGARDRGAAGSSPKRCRCRSRTRLMGKGCLPHEHPLLLGQSGFWGTPIANEKCRTADLIVAVGTRLAEANSSSWDPRFTFSIPPTRLIHIDADLAEIGRNYQTELGVVRRRQARAGGAGRRSARQASRRSRPAARGDRPRPQGVRVATGPISGAPTSSRCGPNAS